MDLSCTSSHLTSSVPLMGQSISGGIVPFGSDMSLRSTSTASVLSTALLLLFGSIEDVSSVITNVSIIQSWNWFMHLSPFESIFLFLIIAEIGALELLGLLPINFTEFWQGEPGGRRKRRRRRKRALFNLGKEQRVAHAEQEIGTKLLRLYRKLDQNECGLRALCELQSKVKREEEEGQMHIPPATRLMLTTFQSYAEQEKKTEREKRSAATGDMSPMVYAVVEPYIEAVKIGSLSGQGVTSWEATAQPGQTHRPKLYEYYFGNATGGRDLGKLETLCQKKYYTCPVTSDEVIEYVGRIHAVSQ